MAIGLTRQMPDSFAMINLKGPVWLVGFLYYSSPPSMALVSRPPPTAADTAAPAALNPIVAAMEDNLYRSDLPFASKPYRDLKAMTDLREKVVGEKSSLLGGGRF